MEERLRAWDQIAKIAEPRLLDKITTRLPLDKVIETAPKLIRGEIRGRIIIDLTAN